MFAFSTCEFIISSFSFQIEAQTTAVVEAVNNIGRSSGDIKDNSKKGNNKKISKNKIETQNAGPVNQTCSAEDRNDLASANTDKLSDKDNTKGSNISESEEKIKYIGSELSLAEASDKFRSLPDFSCGLTDKSSNKVPSVGLQILNHETESILVQSSNSAENSIQESTNNCYGKPEAPKVPEQHKDQPRRSLSQRETRVINPRQRKLSVPVSMGRERCQENRYFY